MPLDLIYLLTDKAANSKPAKYHHMKLSVFLGGWLCPFVAMTAVAQLATVNYFTGLEKPALVDSLGVGLASGNKVSVGYFNSGFEVAANGTDLNALASAWHEFGSTSIGVGIPLPLPGRFSDDDSNSDPSFSGQKVYWWVFQTSDNSHPDNLTPGTDFSKVTAHGIFSSSAAHWQFPSPLATPPGNTISVNSTDVDQVFFGNIVPGSPGSLQLALVPEPSESCLVAALTGMLFVLRRKRG